MVLLITKDGGVVTRTPRTSSANNVQRTTAAVGLTAAGYASVDMTTTVTEDQQEAARAALTNASASDREKWILEHLQLQNVRLLSCAVSGLTPGDTAVTVRLKMTLPRLAPASGSRLFLRPNISNQRTYIPRKAEHRKSPIRFRYPYLDTDSIRFRIPDNVTCEALPGAVSLTSSFGTFRSSSVQEGDSVIVYSRRLEIWKTEIPADRYEEYRRFFTDVVNADAAEVVLVRKQ